jgi:hypothetical protein
MEPTTKTARIAGFLYLLVGLTAPFDLLYVPAKLIVRDDAAATAANIVRSEMLYRTWIATGLISSTAFTCLVMVLYRLFRNIDRTQAAMMVALVLVSIPISLLNAVNELAALSLIRGPAFLTGLDQMQLNSIALLLLRMRGMGVLVAQVFWGLWLLPFGVLVIKSRFIPKLLGGWLIVNGVAYVAMSFTAILLPRYAAAVNRYTFVALFGELWIMLWFVIKGVRIDPDTIPAVS